MNKIDNIENIENIENADMERIVAEHIIDRFNDDMQTINELGEFYNVIHYDNTGVVFYSDDYRNIYHLDLKKFALKPIEC